MILTEKHIESKKIYDGNILHVYEDVVSLPNQKCAVREIIRHEGAVCIVALDDELNVVVEKQFRYPFGRVLTEIPAGKKEKNEDPLECAKRELSEETGIAADYWEYLGEYYPTVAISDEVIHMYMAKNLSYNQVHPDEDEFLSVEKMPLYDLVQMILEGKICDGKTQAAVLKVWGKYYKNN